MMTDNAVRPEEVLPDGIDHTLINGRTVRKGTIAAFLANIDILESTNVTEQQKQAAIGTMKELAPSVIAIGLHKHVFFKNSQAEQILVDANN
jgi:hypothetical protein